MVDTAPRKEKRKELKKLRRRRNRQKAAQLERAADEARLNDPSEQARIQLLEQQEAEALIREQAEHIRQERLWLEREEQARQDAERRQEEELARKQEERTMEPVDEEELEEGWEYVGDGPAEIIWQGNEITVKKSRKKVRKTVSGSVETIQGIELPFANPLPPQVSAFVAQQRPAPTTAVHDTAEQNRNFGTEQDKTNCPFHIKTGVCRFGVSCSRAHVYPEKSCTLLVRHMYNGPGLSWEHEDGLEHTEEEVYEHFEVFYDDVHEEFQKFGELVNFKVCRNGSSHLRGNVYAHYRREEDAMSAYLALNGRYYASKQISCEFVGVTRWKVAICGEYMKARYKPCSRGTVCNFLHCFRNPRGEYSWADWDAPAPRSWQLEMNQLFGCQPNHSVDSPDEEGYGRRSESEDRRHQYRDKQHHPCSRYQSSDGSSDDGRTGRSREHRKSRSAAVGDWELGALEYDSGGAQYNGERKGCEQDRLGSSQRTSRRKARHQADEIGKLYSDNNTDFEEKGRGHRRRRKEDRKHRRSRASDDGVVSPESPYLTRERAGYSSGKPHSRSSSRKDNMEAEAHSYTNLSTSGPDLKHRRASKYSDSDSDGYCRAKYRRSHSKASTSERSDDGRESGRKMTQRAGKRVRHEVSYDDGTERHSHKHRHTMRRRSSSGGYMSEDF